MSLPEQQEPLGGAWLVESLGLELVQPLPVNSRIGRRRATRLERDGRREEIHPPAMRQNGTVAAHLTYHLKHEAIHLELLARVFEAIDPELIAAWVAGEPTGQYARRAAFLFEWITGKTLRLPERVSIGGNYVDALDEASMLVATRAVNNTRWRVRDNLPGTPAFCPVVRWTDASRAAGAFDVAQAFDEQERFFGADILRRSAVWLTLKESRSSFLIEGEQEQNTRIQRFAAVIEQRTGQYDNPLTAAALTELQTAILGRDTTLRHHGLRHSPVFVGETVRHENVVHYVAPPSDAVPGMLEGLAQALVRTAGAHCPAARAAVAAYGLVYIHPLADGNGRVHRFLVNDVLRRDGVLAPPFILPISALITESARERAAYDASLEAFSKPLMARFAHACEFSVEPRVEPDGVRSNFTFTANEAAMPAWRFIDLTSHVEYMGGVIERTIRQELHRQAAFFRSHDQARRQIKEIVEGPDADIDAIIRSARQNQGQLSGKLRKSFPVLEKAGVWERVAQAVREAFESESAE